MGKDTHTRSATKSLVWRIIGVFWLAGITYMYTRNWITTSYITFIHHAVFLVVFYLHERAWINSTMKPKVKYAVKALTYEIGLGNIVLGFITYMITGDVKTMGQVALTYTTSRLVLYYFYDMLWSRKK